MNNINSLNENNAEQKAISQLGREDTQFIESDSEDKEEIIDGYFDMGLISYEGFNQNSYTK